MDPSSESAVASAASVEAASTASCATAFAAAGNRDQRTHGNCEIMGKEKRRTASRALFSGRCLKEKKKKT